MPAIRSPLTYFGRLVTVVTLAALMIACGSSGSDIVTDNDADSGVAVTATRTDSSSATEPIDDNTPTTSSEESETPTGSMTPTEVASSPTPEPSPTVEPSPTMEQVGLKVASQGFGQPEGEREVGWAFVVENPNTGIAFERTEYQIAVLDEAGTILETDSGYINILMPSERTAFAGTLYLAEGAVAHSIEVAINEGDAEPLDVNATFAVDNATYFPDEYTPMVSGIVTNPYNRDLEDVRLSAVAYDAADAIIGGGFTYLNFIPAQGQTGAMVSVATSSDPARVEIFASISGLTLLSDDTREATDLEPLVLISHGFGQELDSVEMGWGFIVENPNQGQGIEASKYNVFAFDEAGTVVGTDSGYINLLLPGETLGFGGNVYLRDGKTASNIVVQVLAGDPTDAEWDHMFSTENVAFVADTYIPKATGAILNHTDETLEDIRVSALAFNEAGEIIGGGYTYVEFVPGQGRTATEVSVTSSSVPTRVEIYPTVTSLTFLAQ